MGIWGALFSPSEEELEKIATNAVMQGKKIIVANHKWGSVIIHPKSGWLLNIAWKGYMLFGVPLLIIILLVVLIGKG